MTSRIDEGKVYSQKRYSCVGEEKCINSWMDPLFFGFFGQCREMLGLSVCIYESFQLWYQFINKVNCCFAIDSFFNHHMLLKLWFREFWSQNTYPWRSMVDTSKLYLYGILSFLKVRCIISSFYYVLIERGKERIFWWDEKTKLSKIPLCDVNITRERSHQKTSSWFVKHGTRSCMHSSTVICQFSL